MEKDKTHQFILKGESGFVSYKSVEQTDDSVKLYFRAMGSIPLLKRDEECLSSNGFGLFC